MDWQDRVRRSFDSLAAGMTAEAQVEPPPDSPERVAVELLQEQREPAYLLYLAGWIAAMSHVSVWAARAAGDADDDGDDDGPDV